MQKCVWHSEVDTVSSWLGEKEEDGGGAQVHI